MKSKSIADRMSKECLAVRARLINRVMTRLYDEALHSVGVTVNQLNILAAVERHDRVRPGRLADTLEMDKSTVSRTTDRMIAHGWLTEHDAQDHRGFELALTAAGRRKLQSSAPHWTRAQRQATELLGEAVAKSLRQAGDRFGEDSRS